MIERSLLDGNKIKIQADNTLIIAKLWGYDADYNLMVKMESCTREESLSLCSSLKELSCAVEEIEEKIKRSNKFRFWIDDEEF